ncbi:outer membrane lipoprotein-sorting protein [Desulforhabdus amnigena]|uniref:Outer membrane lipoprotein-sorting protein n=1 Tax=Desulforhabdus amnigena TaxID=40218 RepID=A0A9W6FUH0_9BACT|nr:outer membrane lipoprotein-sorting protein [Desulforhabdus amnigena]GLI35109.1 outer membrane lipoprotein-sorting protein [Desulforhabdus amnigena]
MTWFSSKYGRNSGSPFSRGILAIVSSLAVLCFFCFPATPASAVTAREILDRMDDLYRGESSHGEMTMVVVTAHWKRTLSLEFWSKGKEKSLIKILAPIKEKDTATLRSGNEIWNYLPKVKRVIKLPSSMMSASWMGSHFTNDDLVKESRFVEDYDFEVTFEGRRAGKDIVEVTCIPKPDAPVVWGKVVVVVRLQDYLPLESAYFDEELHLARTMTFSDVRTFSGRTLPARMVVVPADKPGERTEVTYREIAFDLDLSDEIFSIRNLQK